MFDDFYGLQGRPFQLTPDPAFYFQSLTHRKALSYLGYGLAQGEGFVIITGEVGAGKSTLVAHLMSTIDPALLTAAQVVTSKLDGEELVHVVAQAFGLMISGHDKAAALGAIEAFLHEEARAGRRCLLVVDESQNLSIEALEELRMLSNFQLGAHPLLQTLLLGQPEFRDTLQQHPRLEQLRQRVIAIHHLEAMDAAEIQPYIEHRLTCVGWAGNPAIDQSVFAKIHAATGGIPRRINQIVNRLLLMGAVDKRTRIDSVMLSHVLADMGDDDAVPVPRSASPARVMPDVAVSMAELGGPSVDSLDDLTPVPGFVAMPDAGFDLSAPFQTSDLATTRVDAPRSATPSVADAVTREGLETALAERDAQIAELQQAVLELASAAEPMAAGADPEQIGALTAKLAALDSRVDEQERTIRHTLTMLIEWIESDGVRVVA